MNWDGYELIIVDGGCYAQGMILRLPSGWCQLDIAVWYAGSHQVQERQHGLW